MKKLFILCGFILSAGIVSASTCETRVDQNWNKNTAARVRACLKQEQQESAQPAEESGVQSTLVYTVQYPQKDKKQTQKKQKSQEYKQYQETATYNEYLDRESYPVFKNDSWPASSQEEAHEAAQQALREQRQTTQDAVKAQPVRAQNKKPARRQNVSPVKKETKQPLPQIAEAVKESANENTPSEAEIKQAEALEQDPLSDLQEDDPLKELSLDEDVLSPAGFGYNDTDPAYQP